MRVQRRFLLRSRWTATVPLPGSAGECHFELTEAQGDVVALRAVLTERTYSVAIAALGALAWLLGWQSLAH
jgi:hypothetical protein